MSVKLSTSSSIVPHSRRPATAPPTSAIVVTSITKSHSRLAFVGSYKIDTRLSESEMHFHC